MLMPIRNIAACLCLLAALPSAAQTTNVVAFQGRVSAPGGAAVADGTYAMSFTLFDAAEGGTNLWTETDNAAAVAGGVFVRGLGSVQAFPAGLFADNDDLFLEIAIDIGNDGLDADDIQSPRTPLNAAPLALHAKDAAMVGGVAADAIATSAEVEALEDAIAEDFTTFGNNIAATQSAQDIAISGKVDAAEVALFKNGTAHVFITPTEDPLESGINLLDAYLLAKTLTPNGAPLAEFNRAVVVVPPGTYDIGTNQLALDTDFVDVIGLTTNRESQRIIGASNGPGTGVLRQTADNVRIENLAIECTRSSGGTAFDITDPAAYFPEPDLSQTLVRNCSFTSDGVNAYSMRLQVSYAGRYEDCFAGLYSFGGGGLGGFASGFFKNCTGNTLSFGGGPGGIANGEFIDCTGSFGGNGGTASGTFTNCTGFGAAFGGDGGIASGDFIDCTTIGSDGFGGDGGTASGDFIRCTGGNDTFGGDGGDATGTFIDCTGGNNAFGGNGTATGEFNRCKAGDNGFGAFGDAGGTFTDCTGGTQSFGGGATGSTVGARLLRCEMAGPWGGSDFRGVMQDCRWENGVPLGNDARVYGTVFLSNVIIADGDAGIAHCRVKGNIVRNSTPAFDIANLEDFDVE